ncbi:MAG TPA: hypothetical protein VH589_05570 [Trebonia sp.]|jgi:hypothetical protein
MPKLHANGAARRHRGFSEGYHGCLRIDVRQSAHLYRRIEGWMSAVAASCALRGA